MNYANTKIVTPKVTLDPTPEVLAELYWSLSIEGRHKFFSRIEQLRSMPSHKQEAVKC